MASADLLKTSEPRSNKNKNRTKQSESKSTRFKAILKYEFWRILLDDIYVFCQILFVSKQTKKFKYESVPSFPPKDNKSVGS